MFRNDLIQLVMIGSMEFLDLTALAKLKTLELKPAQKVSPRRRYSTRYSRQRARLLTTT